MTKENWVKHIETAGKLMKGEMVRPSLGGDRIKWRMEIQRHVDGKCPLCRERAITLKHNKASQFRDSMMKGLGLVKVKGNLGGTYWE